MPPGKLQTSILLTLGITAASACDTKATVCLSIAILDSGDQGDTGDTGDTGESEDTGDTAEPTAATRQDATQRVLDRGVLPPDVASRLVKALK